LLQSIRHSLDAPGPDDQRPLNPEI
jgi:hypothetical protein